MDFWDVSRLTWVKELEGDNKGIHLYSLVVWHVSLKRNIRLVMGDRLRKHGSLSRGKKA